MATAVNDTIGILRNEVIKVDGARTARPVGPFARGDLAHRRPTQRSGGDALPWYFRKQKIGPLVGKRTWGGLVGIGGYPELIDGGSVTSPRWALYGLDGEWEVENAGIAPDIDVDLDPAAVRQGHDPQLEKAVEVVLRLLAEHPLPEYKRPTYD